MNNELIARVQADIAKVDQLKVSKIESETKIKTLEENINSLLEKAKELGYNSLEELEQAQVSLESAIKTECEEVEKAFSQGM